MSSYLRSSLGIRLAASGAVLIAAALSSPVVIAAVHGGHAVGSRGVSAIDWPRSGSARSTVDAAAAIDWPIAGPSDTPAPAVSVIDWP